MRASQRWALFVGILMASALIWALRGVTLSSSAPPSPQASEAQGYPVFTPAHPNALAAIRDFFNRRPPPVQPVAFTHKVHLANGMHCTDCHAGVDQGPDAALPGVKLCMTCHQVIGKDHPEIKKLAAYLTRDEEIPWQRVYDYSRSAHVRFNHAVHVRAKVACASCHGDMTQQTTALRAVNLTMAYCSTCHQQRRVSNDCLTCHF